MSIRWSDETPDETLLEEESDGSVYSAAMDGTEKIKRRHESTEFVHRRDDGPERLNEMVLIRAATNLHGPGKQPRANKLPDGTIVFEAQHYNIEWQFYISPTRDELMAHLVSQNDENGALFRPRDSVVDEKGYEVPKGIPTKTSDALIVRSVVYILSKAYPALFSKEELEAIEKDHKTNFTKRYAAGKIMHWTTMKLVIPFLMASAKGEKIPSMAIPPCRDLAHDLYVNIYESTRKVCIVNDKNEEIKEWGKNGYSLASYLSVFFGYDPDALVFKERQTIRKRKEVVKKEKKTVPVVRYATDIPRVTYKDAVTHNKSESSSPLSADEASGTDAVMTSPSLRYEDHDSNSKIERSEERSRVHRSHKRGDSDARHREYSPARRSGPPPGFSHRHDRYYRAPIPVHDVPRGQHPPPVREYGRYHDHERRYPYDHFSRHSDPYGREYDWKATPLYDYGYPPYPHPPPHLPPSYLPPYYERRR